MDKTPTELRGDLIQAMLPHVPFDGWSEAALKRAAKGLGVDPDIALLSFPEGVSDIIKGYLDFELEQFRAILAAQDLSELKIRERIALCVRLRLELAADHKEASLRAARYLSNPKNTTIAAQHLWRIVDLMWRAAGDSSTDFNYYSKRAILSGVYSSTYLFWLSDHSEDHQESWAFLDRRITDVMKIEKAKARWRKFDANRPKLTRFLGRLRYPST